MNWTRYSGKVDDEELQVDFIGGEVTFQFVDNGEVQREIILDTEDVKALIHQLKFYVY